ncbi:hypothetical protein FQN54_001812 [Arachnomyces sp. PD_36]|nr:hypothetical protein FQN54_001812 [Arachnomyces sp. PD_36]
MIRFFSSVFFIFWRIVELIALIIPIGILSYFVDGFVKNNQLTPSYILVLFIVSVLAGVWVLDTLLRMSTTRRSAIFVSFVDLCFVGAFIAGVYQLRDIANADCAHFETGSFYLSLGPFGYIGRDDGDDLSVDIDKTCALLKTSFAFGIMNIIFFFWTSIFALFMHRHEATVVKETEPDETNPRSPKRVKITEEPDSSDPWPAHQAPSSGRSGHGTGISWDDYIPRHPWDNNQSTRNTFLSEPGFFGAVDPGDDTHPTQPASINQPSESPVLQGAISPNLGPENLITHGADGDHLFQNMNRTQLRGPDARGPSSDSLRAASMSIGLSSDDSGSQNPGLFGSNTSGVPTQPANNRGPPMGIPSPRPENPASIDPSTKHPSLNPGSIQLPTSFSAPGSVEPLPANLNQYRNNAPPSMWEYPAAFAPGIDRPSINSEPPRFAPPSPPLDSGRAQPAHNNQPTMEALDSESQDSADIYLEYDNLLAQLLNANNPSTDPRPQDAPPIGSEFSTPRASPTINRDHLELLGNFFVRRVVPPGARIVTGSTKLFEIALSSSMVMLEIFAVSALNLSAKKRGKQQWYREKSRRFQRDAILLWDRGSAYTRENIAPTFHFSALLGFYQFCDIMLPRRDGFGALLEGIVTYFKFMRAHRIIANKHRAGLTRSELKPFLGLQKILGVGEPGQLRQEIDEAIRSAVLSDSEHKACLSVGQDLQLMQLGYERIGQYNRAGIFLDAAMTWPQRESIAYCRLVEKRNSAALVILAHYGDLLHNLCGRWFVDFDGAGLIDTTYLDHAGTTLYAKSLIETFSRDLTTNLFGNPHSASTSSQLSTRRVDDTRLRALRFFNADPDLFDLVFVANATAGIKLVVDALRDFDDAGFWYGYHVDAHTSLVGAREVARKGQRCFISDGEVDEWISRLMGSPSVPGLFAFPAQSNMTGRRLPRRWCREIRGANGRDSSGVFSLLDAASLVSTSPLDLSDYESAPDFTVLSFYKIFGFPDLGALIVRKDSGHIFQKRKYFGGGTVDMAMSLGEPWHAKKNASIHDQLEDGTLPFHSIVALGCAFGTHQRLYGSMVNISRHTGFLVRTLFDRLSSKRHANGAKVCVIYQDPSSSYTDRSAQGPIISFNLRDSSGHWVGKSEVEKLAAVKDIQIRSGTLCNPGGMAYHLGLDDSEMRRNFAAGQRCGDDNDIIQGKPTGALRVSLGAMSNMRDIERFLEFIDEFYVDKTPEINSPGDILISHPATQPKSQFYIENLCIYPIKSCGGFKIPEGTRWRVKREGLDWDREWCLVHQGTGVALNQKRYPRMALIRPTIDLDRGVLQVTCMTDGSARKSLELSLDRNQDGLTTAKLCENSTRKSSSSVCGDQVTVLMYSSSEVSSFFSEFLGVPCTLARFPPHSSVRYSKHSKSRPRQQRDDYMLPGNRMPGSFPSPTPTPPSSEKPILLSNESPILLISRSSVNRLNETIKGNAVNHENGKAVAADVFRANIIVAENPPGTVSSTPSTLSESPYAEDSWTGLQVSDGENGVSKFEVLGPCQRCQMVCVDQVTATRSEEPYSTLAKTRKVDGKAVFGRHICAIPGGDNDDYFLGIGDLVTPIYDDTSISMS